MSISAIPFNMPEPMEIPAHIVEDLRARSSFSEDSVMQQATELLLGIEAASLIVYERVDEKRILKLGGVYGTEERQVEALRESLASDVVYGQPLDAADGSLAGRALAGGNALLIMGRADPREESPLPHALYSHLLSGEAEGNVGYIYVLPMVGTGGRPLGALTLIRPAADGPLNHEQPNLTEGLRRHLVHIFSS